MPKKMIFKIAILLFIMNSCEGVFDPSANPGTKATYIGNVQHLSDMELDAVNSVTTAVIDGSTYLFAAGYADNGISVFLVNNDGTLINTHNIPDDTTLQLSGAIDVTTVVMDGSTYLFVAGYADSGISGFLVNNDGTLTNKYNISDDLTLELQGVGSVSTALIDGSTYLFATGQQDNGISVFLVNNDGTLTNKYNISDNQTLKLQGIRSVATVLINETTYLFAASYNDNGISAFKVNKDGTLTWQYNIADNTDYQLSGAISVTTAVIDNNAYLFVAGKQDNGISVFLVNNDGTLDNKINVTDSGNLALNGVYFVKTALIGSSTYLFVAATANDNGISVFLVNNDGTLSNKYNITDNDEILLTGAQSVTTATIEGTTYLFVASSVEDGIQVFSVDNNGQLSPVFHIYDKNTYQLEAASSLATAVVSNTQYILVAGQDSNGITLFSMEDSGSLVLTGSASNSQNSNYRMMGIKAITITEVGGTTYVLATGSINDGFSIFGINDHGHLTYKTSQSDFGSLNLDGIADIITVEVGGTTYIIAAGYDDNGISSFSLDGQGAVIRKSDINNVDNPNYNLGGVNALASATMGASTYIFAAGETDSGISVFKVDPNGALINIANGNIADGDDPNYNLGGVNALSTAVVGTSTYLFAAGAGDNGISVFKIADNGTLENVENISDKENYMLKGVQALNTITYNGKTYLMAAANVDDGVSIWTVTQNGKLTFVTSVTDNTEYKMDGSSDVLPVIKNNNLYFYVTGSDEDAVNIFKLN